MEKKRWTLKDNMENNECLIFINRADKITWLEIRLLALESLYSGQITLSTLLIKPNICFHSANYTVPTVSLETNPVIYM